MLFSKSSVFSVAIGLAACADAHMLMASPKPYVSQNAQNGPLQASGSDYPCKGEQNYDAGGISNIWPIGSTAASDYRTGCPRWRLLQNQHHVRQEAQQE